MVSTYVLWSQSCVMGGALGGGVAAASVYKHHIDIIIRVELSVVIAIHRNMNISR